MSRHGLLLPVGSLGLFWVLATLGRARVLGSVAPVPASATAPASLPALSSLRATPPVRGVALGLFCEDPGWSYGPLLDEIAALGANEVELVVPWYQRDASSTDLYLHPRFSPTDRSVARAIDDAHARGLRVLLFPIVRLESPRTSNEWRGTLAPTSTEAWFASYSARLRAIAELAAAHKVEALSVGSELSTLDGDPTPWRPLIASIRAVFHGELTYSGNWDHFQSVGVYALVDTPGLCGYFPLGPADKDSDADLYAAWGAERGVIEKFFAPRTFLFTEVGYLSQTGNHATPWAEGSQGPVDLPEQQLAYEAFVRAWDGAAELGGVFFWNWFGWGGAESGGYTPRGKPAAQVIASWFRGRVVERIE